MPSHTDSTVAANQSQLSAKSPPSSCYISTNYFREPSSSRRSVPLRGRRRTPPPPPSQEFLAMEGVGARLGRSSARYGPAMTFTGPVRKWRKEWVPISAATATATATSAAASSTGTGSRGNNLILFKWTPLNGANEGDEEQTAPAKTATRRRRYVPVSVVQDERQESAKSDDENKANDGEPSSTETEQSIGKTNIDDTLMDESQASDEVRDSGNFIGGTDLNLNLGPKDPDGEDEGDTGEHLEVRTEHRLKRKSVTPDLEMRM